MPIYTQLNRSVGPRVIEDFTASRGEVDAARFGTSLALTPLASARRIEELDDAKRRGELVSVDEANEIGAPIGLQFEEDISRPALDIMVERKKKEQERQSVLMRSEGGFVAGVSGFGADLLAQAVDPLNLAVSFIPVVGQSRYLSWASRLGKGKARLARGAVEGFTGNALVEPVVLAAATQEQADYQMSDSLMNIGFGALIGGGLHTLGGRIGDSIKGANAKMVAALDQNERAAVQGAAIADIVEGRDIDVTPAYKVDALARAEEPTPRTSLADDALRDAELEPTARARGELGEDLPAREAAPGILDADDLAARDADLEPLARADEIAQRQSLTDEVAEIHARQDDPGNQRLANPEAAERTKQEIAETPDHTQPLVQERLLDEEQALLDVEMRGVKESDLGDELLEAAGVTVKEEGPSSTRAINEAQKDIDTAKVQVRAMDALADCVGR